MVRRTLIFSPDSSLKERVAKEVRALCALRGTAKSLGRGRTHLSTALTERLVEKMIEAVAHAASRSIPDKARRAGAPADNSRIILAQDIVWACTELGFSAGRRYVLPQSLVVELYAAVALLIWPHQGQSDLNPRSTFNRLECANIVRN
jgi:hypothetical protein